MKHKKNLLGIDKVELSWKDLWKLLRGETLKGLEIEIQIGRAHV